MAQSKKYARKNASGNQNQYVNQYQFANLFVCQLKQSVHQLPEQSVHLKRQGSSQDADELLKLMDNLKEYY